MRYAARLTLLLGLVATTALADRPPPEFFHGRYRAVGRTADTPPALIDEDVRFEPEGDGLAVTVCDGPEGRLRFDAVFEVENFLSGTIGVWPVWCLYFNNGSNYPILNCGTDDGALFALYPDEAHFDAPLRCDAAPEVPAR